MHKIEIGDLFELITPHGKAYLHYVYKDNLGSTTVRVLPGLYSEMPNNIEKIVMSEQLFLIGFSIEAAEKKLLVKKVGHFSVKNFEMPKFMRTGHITSDSIRGWHIVNTSNLHREFVITLSQEQKKLSPFGSWNDTLLKERLSEGWTLDKWI